MKIEGEEYWTERYRHQQTGWDIGYVSTPIQAYIDQLTNKELKILVPGCGNGYEVEYLWNQGFRNSFVVDISEKPLSNLSKRVPDFPSDHLVNDDFFNLGDTFDLIIEQTFFSVFPPAERHTYADKVYQLLAPGGKLVGVLFNAPMFEDHPPYGGKKEDYESVFSSYDVLIMEECINSISARMGSELFIMLQKPKTKV